MMDEREITDMTSKICDGRTCLRCPIDGICLKEQWGDSASRQLKIIEEYRKLFGDGTEIEISDTEILSLFGGK